MPITDFGVRRGSGATAMVRSDAVCRRSHNASYAAVPAGPRTSSTTTEPFSGPVSQTWMGNPSTVVIIAEGTTANYSELPRARVVFGRIVRRVAVGNVLRNMCAPVTTTVATTSNGVDENP